MTINLKTFSEVRTPKESEMRCKKAKRYASMSEKRKRREVCVCVCRLAWGQGGGGGAFMAYQVIPVPVY